MRSGHVMATAVASTRLKEIRGFTRV
ncbi:hypothetical protein Celaphus_00003614 [Cervus elaphus hippelaphus]|uniref:Uncharacterized protein n=1 Tax=Cervus elaphus hippelaphus TaxID=46360 RepID=A0A212D252_CEREH|nr:hypothetical protein Celaphus_00003614 [Cervus elaphus hippelaphus]